MKWSYIIRFVPVFVAVLGAALLYKWVWSGPSMALELRLPKRDKQELTQQAELGSVELKGELLTFNGVAADLSESWPRFRGDNFDNISTEQVILSKTWPKEGPKVLWSIDVGQGYAGAAIKNGMVYVLDYDRDRGRDTIRCMSLADGKDIWRYSYPVKVKRNHGMSRTVPAVTDKYVVTLGPKCHVTCLDAINGEFRWMIDLVQEYGTKVPPWYAGQCPLIEEGKAVIAPGGNEVLMMTVDCETGEIVWESTNQKGWKMTHSSIIPMEFGGKRMYVYCANGGVVGVSAEDGEVLWQTDEWKISIANIPSPLVIGEGRIFLSGGYNSGSMMLQLKEEGEQIVPEILFRLEPEVFGSPQHTPILYENHIYGVRPDGQLTCLNLDGQVIWTSSSSHKFGLGPYMIANGLIYIMNDSGVLTLAEAETTEYTQLAQVKILEGPDSWGPMALAGGRLILRDMNRMICLDITEP
jgi:outer membrane protein assembly factor BamB